MKGKKHKTEEGNIFWADECMAQKQGLRRKEYGCKKRALLRQPAFSELMKRPHTCEEGEEINIVPGVGLGKKGLKRPRQQSDKHYEGGPIVIIRVSSSSY